MSKPIPAIVVAGQAGMAVKIGDSLWAFRLFPHLPQWAPQPVDPSGNLMSNNDTSLPESP